MSDGPEPKSEKDEFTLEDLVFKPSTTSAGTKTPPKAYKKNELFARITVRHLDRLAGVSRVSTVIFFERLMIESVKVGHRPFTLRGDELAKTIGLSRFGQLRALRCLETVGLIKTERDSPKKPPRITIPGTTIRPK